MPNHVDNELLVTGDEKEISRFKEFAEAEDALDSYKEKGKEKLSADKFIPYPQEFKDADKKAVKRSETRNAYIKELQKKEKLSEDKAREKAWKKYPSIKDGYNSGGYGWCIENWGTKWGFYDVELIEDSKDELLYTFNTAWSPALPVIEKMGEMFPSLKFELRYFEGGSCFNGLYRVENGEVTENRQGEYFGNRGG